MAIIMAKIISGNTEEKEIAFSRREKYDRTDWQDIIN